MIVNICWGLGGRASPQGRGELKYSFVDCDKPPEALFPHFFYKNLPLRLTNFSSGQSRTKSSHRLSPISRILLHEEFHFPPESTRFTASRCLPALKTLASRPLRSTSQARYVQLFLQTKTRSLYSSCASANLFTTVCRPSRA